MTRRLPWVLDPVCATTTTRRVKRTAFWAVWAQIWASQSSRKSRLARTGASAWARPAATVPDGRASCRFASSPTLFICSGRRRYGCAPGLDDVHEGKAEDDSGDDDEDRADAQPVGQGAGQDQRHNG